MERLEYQQPPPDWETVIVLWDNILNPPYYNISGILKWIEEAPGGRYHMFGHGYTLGFDFRFERPEDATYFKLKWL
jgi:hypothetical protein